MKQFACFSLLIALIIGSSFTSKDKAYIRKIKKHRKALHQSFKDPKTSPFKEEAKTYKRLDYYPIDPSYCLKATLELTPEAAPFQMPTSNPSRQKQFVAYGKLHFEIQGEAHQLTVYRNLELAGIAAYEKHLFLLFTDLTSGRETYGGGRYIDLEIPESGNEFMLDFNLCYNPYCAYSTGWSCPIPPKENDLPIKIEAGVKAYDDHH